MPLPNRSLVILDVGHGNCAIVKESEHILVVDTGPGSALLEFLNQESISSIDAILISHADQDHIAGVLSLLASHAIRISRIWLNTDSLKNSAIWDDLVYELDQASERNEIEFYPALTRSTTNIFDHGKTQIEILAPSNYLASKGPGSTERSGRKISTNTISAVVRLHCDETPIAILPGDLDEVGLDDLISHEEIFISEILVFPHHGGTPGSGSFLSFTKKLIAKVKPKIVFFSIGRGHHNTPRPDIVEIIRAELPDSTIVCSQLSEHCQENLSSDASKHLSDVFSQGRELNRCCAGTIVVDIDDLRNIQPDFNGHRVFVENCTGPALCLR